MGNTQHPGLYSGNDTRRNIKKFNRFVDTIQANSGSHNHANDSQWERRKPANLSGFDIRNVLTRVNFLSNQVDTRRQQQLVQAEAMKWQANKRKQNANGYLMALAEMNANRYNRVD